MEWSGQRSALSLVNKACADADADGLYPPNARPRAHRPAVKRRARRPPLGVAVGCRSLIHRSTIPRGPHEGLRAELRQDVASLPGTRRFSARTTGDVRYYHAAATTLSGLNAAQGGIHHALWRPDVAADQPAVLAAPQLVRVLAVNASVHAT